MSSGDPQLEVQDCADANLVLPLLERDRRWSAYALCDLDPPYRQNTRLVVAAGAGGAIALLVLYRLGDTTALLPFGEADGVSAILHQTQGLPTGAFYISGQEHLETLAEAYSLDTAETMSRMTVNAADLQPSPSSPLPLERLTPDDAGAVATLYKHWGPTFFDRTMIESGIYYAAREAGEIVAVAGTHVVSPRRGIGAVGGVFTHPDYRGRGLATATTGAVTHALADGGIDLIVLNVRADNAPAIAAYTRLGFRPWRTFIEGRGSRR